jgi:hypothetical protein
VHTVRDSCRARASICAPVSPGHLQSCCAMCKAGSLRTCCRVSKCHGFTVCGGALCVGPVSRTHDWEYLPVGIPVNSTRVSWIESRDPYGNLGAPFAAPTTAALRNFVPRELQPETTQSRAGFHGAAEEYQSKQLVNQN